MQREDRLREQLRTIARSLNSTMEMRSAEDGWVITATPAVPSFSLFSYTVGHNDRRTPCVIRADMIYKALQFWGIA